MAWRRLRPGQNGGDSPGEERNDAQNRVLFRHFHLYVPGQDAGAYSIENVQRMAGLMPPQQEKKIREFILANQNDLMEKWHELSN